MAALLATVTGCAWLERSSVSSVPASIAGGAPSTAPSLSQSGRYVAFGSDASDLVPGDTNGTVDVFVRDNLAKTTERISVTNAGAQSPSGSYEPAISDSGRYVAFTSSAQLGTGDTDSVLDVYLRDRQLGTTTLVSVTSTTQYPASRPVISGDGRTVAFTTSARVIDPPVVIPFGPLVRHLDSATTTSMIDPGAPVVPGDYDLSDDGSRIAFVEFSLSGLTVYANARVADTTTRAQIAAIANFTSNADVPVTFPLALSGDGTVFALAINGLFPNTNGQMQIGTTTGGTPTSTPIPRTTDVALSDDGSNLGTVTNTHGGSTATIRTLPSGTAKVVSANAAGNATSLVTSAAFSGDGEWVAFASDDPSGVSGDARGVTQVYTRSVAQPSPPPS